jgi:thiopurine S-methyltransferase
MELSYWKSRWNKGNTGFHMPDGYPGLKKHWATTGIQNNATVLVPLCGKTLDIIWLASKTQKVIGVEISEKAIEEFLSLNNPDVSEESFANFTIFKSKNIELWCGDFFKLPDHKIPEIQLIYDKSALTALPEEMRIRYTSKIKSLCSGQTKILLHHFFYPRQEMNGPPFSIPEEEISALYGPDFAIQKLEQNFLDIHQYQKFMKRGLKSYLIEFLLLLSPNTGK